jgi:2'-5' RNA ligase
VGRNRIFIGVDVCERIRDNAASLQQALARTGAGVKWVSAAGMHITLLFLGEVDNRDLHAVCRAVKEVAAGERPFSLRIAGVGAFPNARRPKVVWAGITVGGETLQRLHDELETRMLDLGCYRKEEREYSPHLTLGRARGESDGFAIAAELAKHGSWDGGLTQVNEILVYTSELERDGPVYTVVGRGELTGAG